MRLRSCPISVKIGRYRIACRCKVLTRVLVELEGDGARVHVVLHVHHRTRSGLCDVARVPHVVLLKVLMDRIDWLPACVLATCYFGLAKDD